MRRLPFTLLLASVAGSLLFSACGGGTDAAEPTSTDPAVQAGYQLASDRNCTSCHSVDGASRSGPTWKGLDGRSTTLTDGTTVVADDAYLRTAIVNPDAQVPQGYRKGVMSSYTNSQPELSDEQVTNLIAYIKTLK